jgi:8-oxo-dGTP pyrophosphatase MutT (NUDIX family)
MVDERELVVRRSARVVAVAPSGRILLFAGGDPDRPHQRIWHTPGGGVEPGEDDRTAAVREYAEETGQHIELGALVWDRHVVFGFDGRRYDQFEVFYVADVDTEHAVDTARHTHIERRYLTDHRWFSVGDLRALAGSDDLVAPPDLADRLEDLLRDGPPSATVRVAGVVLP